MYSYKTDQLENYKSYQNLAKNEALSIEEAEQIFTEYYDSLDFTEEFFQEEYKKLISHAVEYAMARANWAGLDRGERIEADESRTNTHDRFLNDIARYIGYQERNGGDTHWFEMLAQGGEPKEIWTKRKRIGDWACYIALFVALNQR